MSYQMVLVGGPKDGTELISHEPPLRIAVDGGSIYVADIDFMLPGNQPYVHEDGKIRMRYTRENNGALDADRTSAGGES